LLENIAAKRNYQLKLHKERAKPY